MIDFSFLSPVQDRIVDQIELFHGQAIGKKLVIHTSKNIPELKGIKIAIVGVLESRNSVNYI